jgi:hypothetical protein
MCLQAEQVLVSAALDHSEGKARGPFHMATLRVTKLML